MWDGCSLVCWKAGSCFELITTFCSLILLYFIAHQHWFLPALDTCMPLLHQFLPAPHANTGARVPPCTSCSLSRAHAFPCFSPMRLWPLIRTTVLSNLFLTPLSCWLLVPLSCASLVPLSCSGWSFLVSWSWYDNFLGVHMYILNTKVYTYVKKKVES